MGNANNRGRSIEIELDIVPVYRASGSRTPKFELQFHSITPICGICAGKIPRSKTCNARLAGAFCTLG